MRRKVIFLWNAECIFFAFTFLKCKLEKEHLTMKTGTVNRWSYSVNLWSMNLLSFIKDLLKCNDAQMENECHRCRWKLKWCFVIRRYTTMNHCIGWNHYNNLIKFLKIFMYLFLLTPFFSANPTLFYSKLK